MCQGLFCIFSECYDVHLDLHVLTPSFPARRSADLCGSEPGKFPPSGKAFRRTRRCRDGGAPSHRTRCTRDDPAAGRSTARDCRSEEHTSELQSLMRISYAVFCLKTNYNKEQTNNHLNSLQNIQHINLPHNTK